MSYTPSPDLANGSNSNAPNNVTNYNINNTTEMSSETQHPQTHNVIPPYSSDSNSEKILSMEILSIQNLLIILFALISYCLSYT